MSEMRHGVAFIVSGIGIEANILSESSGFVHL